MYNIIAFAICLGGVGLCIMGNTISGMIAIVLANCVLLFGIFSE